MSQAGSYRITAGPGAAVETLTGNVGGPVPPTAGNINVVGAGDITVTGNPGTSTLTISTSGVVADSFPTDAGTATPAAGILNVLGGTAARDINTSGAGNTIHVDLNNAITLGDLAVIGAGLNALSATTGDINIAAGNLKLPNTNGAGTQGEIQFGGSRFVSNFGGTNTFVGSVSGNTTLTGFSNASLGAQTLQTLTTGAFNTSAGFLSGGVLTAGGNNASYGAGSLSSATGAGTNQNTAIGSAALNLATAPVNNTVIGYAAATNYTTNESNNIIIGNPGVIADSARIRIGLNGLQTSAFIVGIDGVNVGSVAKVVTMASDQLGTATITAGSGITVTPTANTITIAASGTGVVQTITGNTGGAISPTAGNINILTNNTNIVFAGAASTETLDFGLTSNILLGSGGSIAGGTDNTALGKLAGANITAGTDNTAIGYEALVSSSTGSFNTALGSFAMFTANIGATNNTAVGYSSLLNVATGDYNCCIGDSSGSALTLADSNNIMIVSAGVVGDNNTIRIGRPGGGVSQQNKCFICGIDGVNVGSVAKVVTMASDQLGTATITAGTGVTVTPGANTITISASGTTSLTYTNVNTTPYVVLSTDEYLSVDCSGGVITVQLPNAATSGRVFIIKDRTGSANSNTITVTTVGGAVNIDGATTYLMNTQYASIQLIGNGSTYEIF